LHAAQRHHGHSIKNARQEQEVRLSLDNCLF
jgi:hypothetical protein